MKRLDRALYAEAVPALVFGALLYAVLAVTSATLPRLTWLAGSSIFELLRWLAAQLPTALAQTLPIAMVLAVLLTLGRMEGDRELLAFRAGGVALGRIVAPFIVLGALATVATIAVNQWVTPRTHAWVATEYWRMTAGGSGLFRLADQILPVGEFSLTFDRAVDRDTRVQGVRIERWEGDRLVLVRAASGTFEGADLVLRGYRTQIFEFGALDVDTSDPADTLRAFVRLDSRGPSADATLRLQLGVDPDELIARFSRGGFEDARSLTELVAAWRSEVGSASERRSSGVLAMRRLAEPFANVALLLVAVPLSLGWARSRGVAFGLSLVVTLVWYLLSTVGQFAAQSGTLPVVVGPWIANVVLAAVGVVLLVRLQRR